MPIGFTFFGIFDNVYVFLSVMIALGGLIGLASKKLSIASYGGFLVFIYIATNAELAFFTNLMYVFLIFILLLIGFNAWQFFSGESIE